MIARIAFLFVIEWKYWLKFNTW